MNNSTKILIAVLNLVVCALIGYFGTKMIVRIVNRPKTVDVGSGMPTNGNSGSIKRSKKPSVSVPAVPSSPQASNTPSKVTGSTPTPSPSASLESTSTLPTASPDAVQAQDPSTVKDLPGSTQLPSNNQLVGGSSIAKVASISKPVYNESTKSYSFTVVAEGVGLTYCLADDKKRDIRSQSSGQFVVPPTSLGVYNVYVTDSQGNKSDFVTVRGCVAKVKSITKEELQRVLNSKDSNKAIEADFKNRVASGCKFTFVGRNEEEGDAPRSYNEIIQRVSMGTWSSVSVTSVSVNGSGKLSSAVIRVNY